MEGTETTTTNSGGPITPGKTAPKTAGGREQVDPGKYLCAIKHVEKTLTNSGKPRLSWQFRIIAGPNENRVIFDDTYLTEAALWKVQHLAAAAGLTPEQTFDPDKPKELINLFVGRELWVTWAVDKYTNKDGVEVESRKATAYDSTDAKAPQARKDGGAAQDEDLPF